MGGKYMPEKNWRVHHVVSQYGDGGITHLYLIDDQDRTIAAKTILGPSSDEDEANFQKMATVPRLMAALQKIANNPDVSGASLAEVARTAIGEATA
jgi:hypothetical protein